MITNVRSDENNQSFNASMLITMHLSDVLSSYERFYIKKHRYFKLRVHATFHHMIIYMYHCILI